MLSLGAPGIYRIPPAPPPAQLTLVRTDIAGFVGYAERGPLPEDFPPDKFPPRFDAALVARRLTSWDEYRSIYGSFLPNGHLPYSVKGFFESGGDVCYVVRVAATQEEIPPEQQARAAFFAFPSDLPLTIGELVGAIGDSAFNINIDFTGNVSSAAAPQIKKTDLITAQILVMSPSLRQTNMILAVQADGSFLLSKPLDPHFHAHDKVALFPTAVTVTARSRGAWGNSIELRFVRLEGDAFALTVAVLPADGGTPTELEIYRRLLPSDAGATILAQSKLITWEGTSKISFDAQGRRIVRLEGGRDGFSGVKLSDFTGSAFDRRGLRLLEEIDEIGVIAIPDAVLKIAPQRKRPQTIEDPCAPQRQPSPPPPPPDPTSAPATLSDEDRLTLQKFMIEQCERLNSRVAIIDPPADRDLVAEPLWALSQGLINASAKYAALYYPWLTIPDPLAGPAATRRGPPSGFVAGAYAQKDLSAGVWNPPANILLPSVLDVARPISNLQQAPLLDPSSNVNAIRIFPGEGAKIWGARSLAADDAWRFIHARRFMSAIEQTLLRSSRWAVFEINDAALRKALTHSLSLLLEGVWRDGGLNGATPDQAFYVKCDETNNPQLVVDAGQIVCQVGVAIAAPMEFLVFQIRQDIEGGTVVEG